MVEDWCLTQTQNPKNRPKAIDLIIEEELIRGGELLSLVIIGGGVGLFVTGEEMSMSVSRWVVEPILMVPLLGGLDKGVPLLNRVLNFREKSMPLVRG